MNGDSGRRQRLLLMTANVGSLFEEGQRLQDTWLDVISERILSEDADLSVIHMQETGGKRYVECSGQVPDLITALADRLSSSYSLCRAFLDLSFASPAYTALGSIFFVHKDALTLVEQFDFARKQFAPLPTGHSVEILTEVENHSLCVKKKFPKHFWPAIKWGRKGYLHTRWIVDGKVLDLINVHLFHDESNLALIHENPSLYSSNRKRALDFVISACVLPNDDDSSINRFIFGDLNFRLDSRTFLNRLTEEAEPHPMEDLTQHGSQDLLKDGLVTLRNDTNTTENLRRTVSAIEFRREDGEANENCVLRIEKKRFDYFNHVKLQTDWGSYLEDDKEVYNFPELFELPITFPPTYPWSEDPLDSGVFMKTRAPAWCDRVLMNKTAYESLEKHTSIYESIGRQTCMGDHKPVLLAITLV